MIYLLSISSSSCTYLSGIQYGAVFNITPTSEFTAVEKYGKFPGFFKAMAAERTRKLQHSDCFSRSFHIPLKLYYQN